MIHRHPEALDWMLNPPCMNAQMHVHETQIYDPKQPRTTLSLNPHTHTNELSLVNPENCILTQIK